MVTNVKEEGKVKCQQYWPDSDTKDYGPFSVTLSDEQVLTEYIIRKLQLTVRLIPKMIHTLLLLNLNAFSEDTV